MTTTIDHDARIEDIDWMLTHGEHPDRIAARLHTTLGALTQTCRRHNRHDLANTLHQHDRPTRAQS